MDKMKQSFFTLTHDRKIYRNLITEVVITKAKYRFYINFYTLNGYFKIREFETLDQCNAWLKRYKFFDYKVMLG